MRTASDTPSAALEAANTLLLQRRAALRGRVDEAAGAAPPFLLDDAQVENRVNPAAALPAHLGWGSTAVTRSLRRAAGRQQRAGSLPAAENSPSCATAAPPTERSSAAGTAPLDLSRATVRLYPDLGTAMLREGAAAAGRLWLLCRLLDRAGQGALRIDLLNEQLTGKASPHFLCGRRRLRTLLQQGEGIFWTRNRARVWLYGTARAAAALGVRRLHGRPVAIPAARLLADARTSRAFLYAAFHAGREREDGPPRPIARETIATLTGVPPARQREYEQIAGVRPQRNIAVGPRRNPEALETACWEQGGGVFILSDEKGKQGPPGRAYIAWQLPNSYETTLQSGPKGQQKRLNKQLADLSMQGMTGNGERTTQAGQQARRWYFDNGAAAARAFDGTESLYWRRPGDGRGPACWQVLGS